MGSYKHYDNDNGSSAQAWRDIGATWGVMIAMELTYGESKGERRSNTPGLFGEEMSATIRSSTHILGLFIYIRLPR